MELIIVGGGKVGYYLTKTLLEHGHHPHLIEMDPEKCAHMADELDIPVICGDGCTLEVLEAAGARHTDAVVAVTGRDQDNLIACQLAGQVFHVRRTVARINNPKNKDAMIQLGVETPISVTDSIARLIEREVDTAAIRQLIPLNRGEASISELHLPEPYSQEGVRLSQLQLPEESVIVSIERKGQFIFPRGNTQLFGGDKLLVVCADSALRELSKKLGLLAQ
ncbi:MAG TPA: TrkA family potassium uptake protein [Candidatus Anaerotruncus excrementipullorum]|uniref:Trk system potassium uptake protein TrkA n=1 Tax=Candidatus Anaerotruncus excrementipullorum TaxID=2838465 RepID=A0A9D1WP76_9FIRM|nr:TrkA family potassium uptake protein [Candidatus Anaerotruncus excrementipullorum]